MVADAGNQGIRRDHGYALISIPFVSLSAEKYRRANSTTGMLFPSNLSSRSSQVFHNCSIGILMTPHKTSKHPHLTIEEPRENCALAQFRPSIEQVIRRLKILRLLKGMYCHDRRRFGLRLSLFSGLLNHTLQAKR